MLPIGPKEELSNLQGKSLNAQKPLLVCQILFCLGKKSELRQRSSETARFDSGTKTVPTGNK